MKLFWFVFVTGSILFFLVVQAFKLDVLSVEMLTHNLYHFFIGFVILNYFFFHMTLKIMKFLLLLVLALLVLDEIFDYARGVGNITVELLILNFYLVFWGGLSGFTFARYWTVK
ncbi:MAG: hypothetical protein ACRERU_13165 [Methylococcales bacterium]